MLARAAKAAALHGVVVSPSEVQLGGRPSRWNIAASDGPAQRVVHQTISYWPAFRPAQSQQSLPRRAPTSKPDVFLFDAARTDWRTQTRPPGKYRW